MIIQYVRLRPLAHWTIWQRGRRYPASPGIANLDFNLRKNFRFPITADRTADLQFSAEAYNIFNHPNFVGLGAVFNTPISGRLTGALDPRNMNFKFRLTF